MWVWGAGWTVGVHFGERRHCGDDGGREERAILDDVHVLSGCDLHGHDGCE